MCLMFRVCKADSEFVAVWEQRGRRSVRFLEADPAIRPQICRLQVSPAPPANEKRLATSANVLMTFLFSQQDAQEFLRFLLDGLHNDVNRASVLPKVSGHNNDHLG